MKHPNHICRFNDGESSCECYDKGYEDGKKEAEDVRAEWDRRRLDILEMTREEATLAQIDEEVEMIEGEKWDISKRGDLPPQAHRDANIRNSALSEILARLEAKRLSITASLAIKREIIRENTC